MDRLTEYSELLSLWSLGLSACVAAGVFFLVPTRVRLPLSLAVMQVLMTVGRLPEMGSAASLCKVLSSLWLVVVACAAIRAPGRSIQLPKIVYAYLFSGVASLWFVSFAEDRSFALVLRGQWLLLAVSALLCTRKLVGVAQIRRLLGGLFIGMGAGCLITFSSLVLDPLAAVHTGFGRYMPYGCNPNQIGILFAMTTSVGMYFALTHKNPTLRIVIIAVTALAFGQALLSVSRGSFLIMGVTLAPCIFYAVRQPAYALAAVVLMASSLLSMTQAAEYLKFERLGYGLETRTLKTMEVLEEVQARPWFGVGGTRGLYAYDHSINGHNAYVTSLYLGGLVGAAPLFVVQLYGLWCAGVLWQHQKRTPMDPLLRNLLTAFSLALVLHGFVNDTIYYPTYSWAFLNVLVPSLLILFHKHAISRAPSKQLKRTSVSALPARPALPS